MLPFTKQTEDSGVLKLPPELLPMIFAHLSLEDQKKCSLVQSSWAGPSQVVIHRSIKVDLPERADEWKKHKNKESLNRNARSLSCRFATASEADEPPRVFLDKDLRNFLGLVSLKLYSGSLPIGTFSAFESQQVSLRVLDLTDCSVTTNGLVDFVNYFTKLEHLKLFNVKNTQSGYLCLESSSNSLRGLSLSKLTASDSFLSALFDHMSWKEVAIYGHGSSSSPEDFIRRVDKGVEVLNLQFPVAWNAPSLSNFSQLRELGISGEVGDLAEIDLLSGITSKNIRKITITKSVAGEFLDSNSYYWHGLDTVLCRLCPQEGPTELEVEIQSASHRGGLKYIGYLPGFQRVGRVRFVYDEKVLYCNKMQ